MSKQTQTIVQEIQGTVDEIIRQIRKLIKKGNAKRVIVKNKNGKTLFQSQLTLGAAGAAFFAVYSPVLTAVATLVLMASDVTVLVESDVDPDNDDEYEVDAEIIEIKDGDEDDDNNDETEKTVGKK